MHNPVYQTATRAEPLINVKKPDCVGTHKISKNKSLKYYLVNKKKVHIFAIVILKTIFLP